MINGTKLPTLFHRLFEGKALCTLPWFNLPRDRDSDRQRHKLYYTLTVLNVLDR